MPSIHRIPFSGASKERAVEAAQAFSQRLAAVGEAGLPELIEEAWRSARGPERWVVTGRTVPELTDAIRELVVEGHATSGRRRLTAPRTVFVFSGMGPQWPGMGRTLARALPRFAEHLATVDAALAVHAGYSVWEALERFDPTDTLPTELAQPGNFLIQTALYRLLTDEGVVPDAIIGHSAGEVASAHAAGVYDLATGAKVAVTRGKWQATVAGRGSMLAAGLTQAEAEVELDGITAVSIAAINDPQSLTFSGDTAVIEDLEQRLRARNVFARRLRVEVPYHSPVQDEITGPMVAEMGVLPTSEPTIPLYSTVTGALIGGSAWEAGYWARNIRQPVLFAAAAQRAMDDGATCFVELAPHPVLSPSLRTMSTSSLVVPTLSRQTDEYRAFTTALAELAVERIGRPARRPVPGLPAPERHPELLWDEARAAGASRRGDLANPDTPLLGRSLGAGSFTAYETELSLADRPWIEGHTVEGMGVVVPAALWTELLALGVTGGEDRPVRLHNLRIVAALILGKNQVRIRIEVDGPVARVLSSSGRVGEATTNWQLHAVAEVGVPPSQAARLPVLPWPAEAVPGRALYRTLAAKGLRYTSPFTPLERIEVSQAGMARGRITTPEGFGHEGRHSPWVIDAGLQLLVMAAGDVSEDMYLPAAIGSVTFHAPLAEAGTWEAEAEITRAVTGELVGDVVFHDADGVVVAELSHIVTSLNGADHRSLLLAADRQTYATAHLGRRQLEARLEADWAIEVDDLEVAAAGLAPFEVALLDPEAAADPDAPEARWVALDGMRLEPPVGLALPPLGLGELADSDEPVHAVLMTATATPATNGHGPTEGPGDVVGVDPPVAVATFAAVNRLAPLLPPGSTLTILGAAEETWLLGLRRAGEAALRLPLRTLLLDADASPAAVADVLDRTDVREVRVGATGWSFDELTAFDGADLRPVLAPDSADGGQHGLVWELTRSLDRPVAVVEESTPLTASDARIRVEAVAFTWKDLGKLHGTLGPASNATFSGNMLGVGLAGTVVKAGPEALLPVGAKVFGPARGPLRQYYHAPASTQAVLRRCPDDIDLIPVAAHTLSWTSAVAILDDLVRLRPGDRVLVQSGAGALGSALCRLALSWGAEVVTTVGDESKIPVAQAIAERLQVVVARGDAIPDTLAAAGQTSFDCIVAAVTEPARSGLIRLLAPGGHYVDVGKPARPDELQPSHLLDRNRTVSSFDIDQLGVDDVPWYNRIFDRALPYLTNPANHGPVHVFGIDDLSDALDQLGRGHTNGPMIVTLDRIDPAPRGLRYQADPAATYVISGGYGAIGLRAAQWLVARGATSIRLLGRSGKAGAEAEDLIALLGGRGASVTVEACDVGSVADVQRLAISLATEGRRLGGVLHAAGAIHDGLFDTIDAEQVSASFIGKATGADHLVRLLAVSEADFVIFTSSASGVLGLSVQGTYAAANTYLDGLAGRLRSRGVAACSLQLGPIAGGGMADNPAVERYFRALGFSTTPERHLFPAFDLAATTDQAEVGFFEADWRRLGRTHPSSGRNPLTCRLVSDAEAASDGTELRDLVELPLEDRTSVLATTMAALFADALGVQPDALDVDTPFAGLGADSLTIVEVQVALTEALQYELPLSALFDPDVTLGELARRAAVALGEIDLAELGDLNDLGAAEAELAALGQSAQAEVG